MLLFSKRSSWLLDSFGLDFGEDSRMALVEIVEALAGVADLGCAGFVVVDDAAVEALGGGFVDAFGAFRFEGFDQFGAVEVQAFA